MLRARPRGFLGSGAGRRAQSKRGDECDEKRGDRSANHHSSKRGDYVNRSLRRLLLPSTIFMSLRWVAAPVLEEVVDGALERNFRDPSKFLAQPRGIAEENRVVV